MHFSDLLCQILAPLHPHLLHLRSVFIPRYHIIYQDSFITALGHKFDIGAIALQVLGRQDILCEIHSLRTLLLAVVNAPTHLFIRGRPV